MLASACSGSDTMVCQGPRIAMTASQGPTGSKHRPVIAPRRTRLQAARHTRAFRWIDPHFTHRWRIYVSQSATAGLLLWFVLLAQDIISNGVIVAAIASSVAIVFFVPHSVASSPVRIVGGHVSAVLAAYIVVGIALMFPDAVADARWFTDFQGALALALVVLLMSITNTEHAPAAGTALGLAIRGAPWEAVVFIITAAALVAVARIVLGPRLHNLM